MSLGIFGFYVLYPSALLLLPVVAALIVYIYARDNRYGPGVPWPSLLPLLRARLRAPEWMLWFPYGLRFILLCSLVIALSRPYRPDAADNARHLGLDIALAIDTSGSMRALDFFLEGQRTTRMEVVKHVVREFVRERHNDQIGLIIFGSEAFTQAPLTLDHTVLEQVLSQVDPGIAGESTAIGDALGTAVARLKDIEGQSKIVILLTDGENNSGILDPKTAAQTATTYGIRLYTIGVGTDDTVPALTKDGQQYLGRFPLDEQLLKDLAESTGGKAFFAQDTDMLKDVYQTIDKIERRRIDGPDRRKREEWFAPFIVAALVLLLCEVAWGMSRFRRIPA